MAGDRDLGFIKWNDKYAKYEDMMGKNFKLGVAEENKEYNKAIKNLSPKSVESWEKEFYALENTYDILLTYHWSKYQINIRPDNRYIPTIEISVKNEEKKVFSDVVKYGNTDDNFWIITDSTEGNENLSLFIYDENFKLIKEISNVGDTAVSVKQDIYYLGAQDIFWFNKLYKINTKLEISEIYEEREEKYVLALQLPKYQEDIFLLRHSALYQDLGYIDGKEIKWLSRGFGTKKPINVNSIAYDTYFINGKSNVKIHYPKGQYLEHVFQINAILYFVFTSGVFNSLYKYDKEWIKLLEPNVCSIKLIEEIDSICIGYPNSPDKIYKLEDTLLTFTKENKGPYFKLINGKTEKNVPWFAVSKNSSRAKGIVVYGYGSYGMSLRKNQQRLWIPWINKGYTIAFLGIRGGRENGDSWWDQSRTASRRINGLNDFIDGTKYLQKHLHFNKRNTIIFGRSAGGFLVTAVSTLLLNEIAVIYAAKPYTDYLRTASNRRAMQTVQEMDEFGLGENPADFLEILKISPQENIVQNPKNNPAVILTGGLNDSEVPAYMPLKYVKALKDASWSNVFTRIEKEGHFTKRELEFREAHDAALIESLIV